jgi:hypothetical protein
MTVATETGADDREPRDGDAMFELDIRLTEEDVGA